MVKGDLSLHEGCGAVAVPVAEVPLAAAVGPGIRLMRENSEVVVVVAGGDLVLEVATTVAEGEVGEILRALLKYDVSIEGCIVLTPG